MIAIVYPQFYGVGGIARYIDSFLTNLPANHPTIYLITGDEHKVDRHYANVELIHLPFSSSRFNLFFWTLKARKILNQLYAEKKIQYTNLHIPPLITGLLLPKKIPLILTAHTTYIGMSGRFYKQSYFVSQWGNLEIKFKLLIEKYIFTRASKIITLTEQGRQELLTYGITKPINVIPNGVDTSLFKPNLAIIKDIDILFCGRIERRKGSRAMVQVCEALIQQKNDIKILIVGYGDDDAWVKMKLAPFADNVTLTGKVNFDQMQAYYQQSKCYVSTSLYEGLPGTCLEAMAMNLPVVAWDFLFYQGLIKHGETGYLVEPNNIDLMKSTIIELLSNDELRQAMQLKIRANIMANYNWQVLSQQILLNFKD
jgi:glycosyltransferase involved in cell wall biosynthesis